MGLLPERRRDSAVEQPRPALPARSDGRGFGECGQPHTVIGDSIGANFADRAARRKALDRLDRMGATRPPVPMAIPRSEHCVLMRHGEVIIIGGRDRDGRPVAAVERWAGGKWTGMGLLPVAVAQPIVAAKRSDLVVLGGLDPSGRTSSHASQWDGHSWRRLPDWPRPRNDAAAMELRNGFLVVGGQLNGRATAACDLWTGSAWKEGPPLSLPRAAFAMSGLQIADGTTTGGVELRSVDEYVPAQNRWRLLENRHMSSAERAMLKPAKQSPKRTPAVLSSLKRTLGGPSRKELGR